MRDAQYFDQFGELIKLDHPVAILVEFTNCLDDLGGVTIRELLRGDSDEFPDRQEAFVTETAASIIEIKFNE